MQSYPSLAEESAASARKDCSSSTINRGYAPHIKRFHHNNGPAYVVGLSPQRQREQSAAGLFGRDYSGCGAAPGAVSIPSFRQPGEPVMSLPPCFANRREAASTSVVIWPRLAISGRMMAIRHLCWPCHAVVLPVAYEVARALDATLDVLLVRKIGAPGYPELALGAVVEGDAGGSGPHTVVNDDPWARRALESGAFDAERGRQLGEICRRQQRYRQGHPVTAMAGRRVIVVDDGVATGATMRAALDAVRMAGAAEVVAAVPVGSVDGLDTLRAVADRVVCLNIPENFGAVGAFYLDFTQTSDDEAVAVARGRCRRTALGHAWCLVAQWWCVRRW
jgi:putative phosphoribosyl transferase